MLNTGVVALAAFLLMVVAFALTDVVDAAVDCRPQNGLNARKCLIKRRKCLKEGIVLKFVGRGCRGCQCDGYCGYLCPQRCNADRQCHWNVTTATCNNKATGLPGGPLGQCLPAGTGVPSVASPTSSPIVPVPTPTASPILAGTPTSSPIATPTTSPILVGTPTSSPIATPTTSPIATPTSSPISTPTTSPVITPTTSPIVAIPG